MPWARRWMQRELPLPRVCQPWLTHLPCSRDAFTKRGSPCSCMCQRQLVQRGGMRREGIDLFHSLFYAPPVRRPPGVKVVQTVHDLTPLLFPEGFTFRQRLVFRVTFARAAHLVWRLARRDSRSTAASRLDALAARKSSSAAATGTQSGGLNH